MSRGVFLRDELICFSLALLLCCSQASHEGYWSINDNPTAPLWRSQSKVEGSRPQDVFRQTNAVTDSSTNAGPFPFHGFYLISQPNPTARHVLPKKPGQSGSSAADSSNQYLSVSRTLPSGSRTERFGQFVPGKPDFPKTSSRPPFVWKPQNSKVQQKPGFDTRFKPPKEFMAPTSGLSRGTKKMYQNSFPTKHSASEMNPVVSSIHSRYDRPISQYLGVPLSYPAFAYDLKDVSMMVHKIPWEYGGHPIKRPGDDDDEEEIPTTEKPRAPSTRRPPKTFTLPPRRTEAFRTREPRPHRKSNWIQVLSFRMKDSHKVPVRTV